MKKGICLLICLALVLSMLSGCESEPEVTTEPTQSTTVAAQTNQLPEYADNYGIRAAVVYSGGSSWVDTLYYLEQSPMLGLSVQGIQAAENMDFAAYDVLYLDDSLLHDAPEGFAGAVENYVHAGGAVFLTNGFCQIFSKEFLGVSELQKLGGCCAGAEYPACEADEGALQQLVKDYSELYVQFADYGYLSQQDYGWGVIADTAQTLVSWNGVGVYTLNQYGEGTVLLTNPLLPSAYSTGSLTMELVEGKSTFASTTSSFNQLMLCGFAEYIAKQNFGYALERAYGYFGTPSMAWELHYEEITGIANDSMQIFSELCEEYYQIPSFTLIRNSYTWFLRSETVTYLLNQGESGYDYQMDYYESAYSSGTHVDAAGQWLTLASQENAGSYFVDYPEYTVRAYPQAGDFDSDGLTDIVSGSSDGKIYLFTGTGYTNGRVQVAGAQVLTDIEGKEICCGSFSAPQLADLNGDNAVDLICGWNDGTVRWYAGNGTLSFTPQGVLLDSDISGQVLPCTGDANGDGIVDLAVGSNSGILMIYFGEMDVNGTVFYRHSNSASLSKAIANAQLGNWVAPAFVDWNEDGCMDVAVGVYHGYIAILLAQGDGRYVFHDYITADEMNYKGNHNLKFGNWAVPCFTDLNGDGKLDLLCGSQEYGVAYPIDSGYFPYEEKLREQVDYAKEHEYYVGVHFYTNAYASAQRENYELLAHKKAMEYYAMDMDRLGVNQHTWYTSRLSGAQTMESIWDAGLYWQSGFAAPASPAGTPQVAPENVVALPFFLMNGGERTTLVQNNATLMYANSDWYEVSARYHMPVCIYYHCDFAYQSDDPSHKSLQTVQSFRETYGYNFNREDQLMLASAAALHQTVEVQGGLTGEGGVSLQLGAPSGEFALYDEQVYDSLGVRVVFSDRIDAGQLQVDADVWYREGNSIVLGLNRDVTLCLGAGEEKTHIRRINMAAEVIVTQTGAVVQFLSGGMMELAVEGAASTDSPGWEVIHRDNETVFIKYGSCESLNLIF